MGTKYAAETYQPRLEASQEYQDFIARQLLRDGLALVTYQSRRAQIDWGENALGMEIKFDRRLASTGNVCIEVAEKADPNNRQYAPSGIYREDNAWLYAIGNYRGLYVFSKRTLQLEHASGRHRIYQTSTSQGFLIPTSVAVNIAERFFGPWMEEEWGANDPS